MGRIMNYQAKGACAMPSALVSIQKARGKKRPTRTRKAVRYE